MASSVTALHSLGQDDQNEVPHDFFGHVIPMVLALALRDINGVINATTEFLRSIKSYWDTT